MSLVIPQGGNRRRIEEPKLSIKKKADVSDEGIDRLEEIKVAVLELIGEAEEIVRRGDNVVYARAKAYWIPHVIGALTKEHEYLGGSMQTMEETIEELREHHEPEEEE